METTAATANTEVPEQQKSDVDSDCGHDNMLHPAPCLAMESKDQESIDAVEEGQEGSVDHPIDHEQVGDSRMSPKQRQEGSQSGQDHPKRGTRDGNVLQSISRKNRVNGLLGQGKGRGMKEAEEKARHVNEA